MNEVSGQGVWVTTTMPTFASGGTTICPDLLRFEQLGEADRLRGRVVRAFFRVMRFWP